MKTHLHLLVVAGLGAATAFAEQPALTIYNQNFAVVLDTVPLELKPGENEVRYDSGSSAREAFSARPAG